MSNLKIVAIFTILISSLGWSKNTEEILNSNSNTIHITLEEADDNNFDDSKLLINFKITNRSNRKIMFANRFTPFGDILSDMFSIGLNGKRIPYIGKLARYAPVRYDEMIHLNPGESRIKKVNISHHYKMINTGTYKISFKSKLLVQSEKNFSLAKLLPIHLKSNLISLEQTVAKNDQFYQQRFADVYEYMNCRGQQANIANRAKNIGAQMSTVKSDRVHRLWFGTGSRGHVANIMANARRTLPSSRPNCNCDIPNPGQVYAYVYPNDRSHNIYLCGAFWPQADTGRNTKGGTMVHEVTHFNDVGRTQDHVYGYEESKRLARTDPQRAINCAENYTWYSEGHAN